MKFTAFGESFDGFDHPYNTTICNERAVEVPLALSFLSRVNGAGLEVGNVLSHYVDTSWRVVDKYEGPERVDVFDIVGEFDFIVAISTLEHVGWDYPEPRERGRAVDALAHLRSLLGVDGRMFVTVPMGCNPSLDDYLLDCDAVRCATLVRHGSSWRQTKKLTSKPYGASTMWAESVWVGEFGGL
jgi:hypothetical protein